MRPEDSELLKDWAQTVRKKQAIPTQYAYRRGGKYETRTLEERFAGWSSVPQAFRNYAKGKRQWRDVLALLPDPIPKETRVQVAPCRGALQLALRNEGRVPTSVVRTSSGVRHYKTLKDRATCGNPIEYCGLRHEPVNEQGVVLLFGMLAKDLGYVIEAVQTGFPDCEAKRQSGAGRWQRVNIEFEFESKNFRQHGHPSTGCDVMVCWRHNWPDCPKHIEVLELSSVIKSQPSSED